MRFILLPLFNVIRLVWLVLTAPLRALGASRRPEHVRFRLTGDPSWRRSPRRRLALFQRTDPAAVDSLESLRRQLEVLAKDPRVLGVIIEVDGLEAPPAKRDALAEMFKALRTAGKKVVGYGVSVSNAEYELLCSTDRIVIPAAGRIDLTGFSAEASAMGAALARIGVKPHFLRRGEYKTAPEMFTREDMSPAQRETTERLLDERYLRLIDRVAGGRKLTPDEARKRIDVGPFSARRAKAQGLIDDLCSAPDLPVLLAPEGRKPENEEGRAEARVGTWSKYLASRVWPPGAWRPVRPTPPVGVVPINGMIAEGRGGTLPAGPVVAGSISIISALDRARRNPRVPAVVVYVTSPGGSAPASEMILDAVRRLARKKPVVAYFDRVAASGGYMAACGAKEIWGGSGGIVGSIGVFGGKFDVSGLMGRIGVHRTLITRGENSAIHSPSRGFTEHELRSLEAEMDETYHSFLDIVAEARGRTKEEIEPQAGGRVYSSDHARTEGLIDRVGTFEDACRRALELAGKTPPDRFDVQVFTTRPAGAGLIGMLRQLARGGARVYTLWWPWVRVTGEGAIGPADSV